MAFTTFNTCSLAAIILLINIIGCQKLIMVQELFRHGARYPVYPKNDDGSNYTFIDHSVGQLTTNGKKMHYLLGGQIYNLYWSQLFGNTEYVNQYNQSKFYIKSTDVNRTIESVQSHMMGIFQNLPELSLPDDIRQLQFSQPAWPGVKVQAGTVFPKAKAFHPIAIHVQKGGSQPYNKGDFLRTYSSQNCPNQLVWQAENRLNKNVIEMTQNKNFTAAIAALSKQVGRKLSFYSAAEYYDNYYCAKYMGRPFPSIFQNHEYRHPLNYIHTLQMYINLYMNQKQIRATSTGFFNQTVLNMKKIIQNPSQVQWYVYSAHDTTVGNMLAGMNMTNIECIYDAFINNITENTDTCIARYPNFSSNIIFELYQNGTKNHLTHFVRIRYDGEYRQIPFCGYKMQCTKEEFFKWYDGFKDEAWGLTCGLQDAQKETYFSIAVAEFAVILTMLIAYMIHRLQISMNKGKDFIQVGNKKKDGQDVNDPSKMIKQSLLTEQDHIQDHMVHKQI